MLARTLTVCLAAALLLGTGSPSNPVRAKPPDLPINLNVNCEVENDLIPGGGLDLEIEIGLDDSQPEILDVMPTEIEILDVMPKEDRATPAAGQFFGIWESGGREITLRDSDSTDVGLRLGTEPDASLEYTCPYLNQKALQAQQQAKEPAGLANSVLENLEKITRARKTYFAAERLRRTGNPDEAIQKYEEVQHLCPGSRYDRLAAKRLDQLHAAETAEAEAEEQSAPPPRDANPEEDSPCIPPEGEKALLEPKFPPVDPDTVEALDRILPETVEPPDVVLEIGGVPNGEEAQETKPEQERSPVDVEIEILFGNPQTDMPENDECPGCTGCPSKCGCKMSNLLQRVCETIRQANGFDLDINKSGSVRVRCSFQLGKLEFSYRPDRSPVCALDLAVPACFLSSDMRWWMPPNPNPAMKAQSAPALDNPEPIDD